MEKFTASNGAQFEVTPQGGVTFLGGIDDHLMILGPAMTAGLREFFRAERDEELGRWRWPENPDYVVYQQVEEEGVRVIHESSGYVRDHLDRRSAERQWNSFPAQAAVAYLDAHPEPKPWHDAKPGEVWLFKFPAVSTASVKHADGHFYDHHGNKLYPRLEDEARRIWPEDVS